MSSPQTSSHYPSWPLPIAEPIPETPPHPCAYFPDRTAVFRAFIAESISPSTYHRFMDAGFRRSGQVFYQPTCPHCRDCRPLRVSTAAFTPSKSQRRILRKNVDLQIHVAAPNPTAEKFLLYQRYQSQWHNKDGHDVDDLPRFIEFLYQSPVQSLEFEYRDPAGTLLAVGLTDVSPQSLSSVYFYFDPAHARSSLGTFSALHEIQFAREGNIPYWYAGYYIHDAPTMSYKARFKPCELLDTDGVWRRQDPIN